MSYQLALLMILVPFLCIYLWLTFYVVGFIEQRNIKRLGIYLRYTEHIHNRLVKAVVGQDPVLDFADTSELLPKVCSSKTIAASKVVDNCFLEVSESRQKETIGDNNSRAIFGLSQAVSYMLSSMRDDLGLEKDGALRAATTDFYRIRKRKNGDV